MRKYLTVLASFIIMLCIGSIYAWSLLAFELIENYKISVSQSQILFGTLIAIFPITMIFVGQICKNIKHRYLGYISGILFCIGYSFASYSEGDFTLILIGIGVLVGIATGFGYWLALTSPIQWFPNKKGLITGIASAGFGFGAVFMSEVSEKILANGNNVLQLFKIVGISYGLIIFTVSNFIYQVKTTADKRKKPREISHFIRLKTFKKLFLGIFLGTFAGLLIIGSLGIIGGEHNISNHTLVLGVALFAIANFFGRLIWGYFSDHFGASFSIFLALLFQSASIISLNTCTLSNISYVCIALLIGFGFGGNFVLFAKETAQVFGVKNFGTLYPYIFVGYGIAGIVGPSSGGFLYEFSGSFSWAIILASFISLMGSLLFLHEFITSKKLLHEKSKKIKFHIVSPTKD